jgi:hypothetical protein
MLLSILLLALSIDGSSWPLPPDLDQVEDAGCLIVEHDVADELNAKTKKYEAVYHYRAEPKVRYVEGHKPSVWQLPEELMAASKTMRPGAIVDAATPGEAAEACLTYTRYVREAKRRAIAEKKTK